MSRSAQPASAAEIAADLDRRLGDPPTLTFPGGWDTSRSWYRAQKGHAEIESHNHAEWGVILGHPHELEPGAEHECSPAWLRVDGGGEQ